MRQQPIRFFFDHAVAFACQLLELRPVSDSDLSATVANDSESLELSSGRGDAFSADTEHIRDEVLSYTDARPVQAIERKQQPTAQLLID